MSDDDDGGNPLIGILGFIGILVLVNVLSMVFNWGVVIY